MYNNLGEVLKDYELIWVGENAKCASCDLCNFTPCPPMDFSFDCTEFIFKRRPMSVNTMLERLIETHILIAIDKPSDDLYGMESLTAVLGHAATPEEIIHRAYAIIADKYEGAPNAD